MLFIFVLLVVAGSTVLVLGENAFVVDGNRVYVDDSMVYISVQPHTLKSSGYIYVNFTSKVYTGNADIVFGFDTNIAKPMKAELYAPYYVYWNTSHSYKAWNVTSVVVSTAPCDYGNEYNQYKRNITQSHISSNWSEIISDVFCFDSYEQTGNNYTAYWNTVHNRTEDWKDYTHTFSSINHDFGGMNKWYYVKNIPIVAGNSYLVRSYIKVPIFLGNSEGKYWFAVKPSSETIQEAIASNHLYYLDPWWNSTWLYRQEINITNTAGDLYNYEFNITLNSTNVGENFDWNLNGSDIRFVNDTDTELYYYIDPMEWNSTEETASIWINVTYLKNDTDNRIYMYYGNNDVSTTSSPDNVFQEWVNNTDAGSFSCPETVSVYDYNGKLLINSSITGAYSGHYCEFTLMNATTPAIIEYYYYINKTLPRQELNVIHFSEVSLADGDKRYAETRSPTHDNIGEIEVMANGALVSLYSNFSFATWYKMKILLNSTASYYLTTPNRTILASALGQAYALNSPSVNGRINVIGVGDGTTQQFASNQSYYWIRIRQLAQPQPYLSIISAEEDNVTDIIPPALSITLPTNTTYTNTNITLEYTIDEADACWYSLNNGNTNVTLTNCNNATFIATEGLNTLNIYANDTSGNINDTERVSFTVDTVPPSLVIVLPENTTYNYNESLPLNYTVGIDADYCWFNLDSNSNTSLAGCINATFNASENWHVLYLYVNDTAGNENSSSIAFTVLLPVPSEELPTVDPVTRGIIGLTSVLIALALVIFIISKTITFEGLTVERIIAVILTTIVVIALLVTVVQLVASV